METPQNTVHGSNQPSEYFLFVDNFLTMMTGLLWGTAYLFYIRQSFKDLSYGLPLLALCVNVGWDVVYGLFYPAASTTTIEYLSFILCPFLNFSLVYSTVRCGKGEWNQSPLVQHNLALLTVLGCAYMAIANWSFVALFSPDIYQAMFWSAVPIQNLISWNSITQLLVRGSIRGQTLTIWTTRFIASLCAIVSYYWRAYNYPNDWSYVYTPTAIFLVTAAEIGEIAYPIIFLYVRKEEGRKKQV